MYILVISTVANSNEAEFISRELLKAKLASCVNITEKVNSLYFWQGEIENSKEVMLVIKSKQKLFSKIEKRVKELHSYEVTEIIALPILTGSQEYLNWIDESLK